MRSDRVAGAPPEVVQLIAYLFAEVLDGRKAHVADGDQRALGRPPRDFAEYARAAAATSVLGQASRQAHAGVKSLRLEGAGTTCGACIGAARRGARP